MINKIKNRNLIKQIRSFENFKVLRPTDIDLFMEYEGKVFIFGELKYTGTELTTGQRLALERLSDLYYGINNKKGISIVSSHNSNENEDIDVANSKVEMYRYNKKWNYTYNDYTLEEFISIFLLKSGYNLKIIKDIKKSSGNIINTISEQNN